MHSFIKKCVFFHAKSLDPLTSEQLYKNTIFYKSTIFYKNNIHTFAVTPFEPMSTFTFVRILPINTHSSVQTWVRLTTTLVWWKKKQVLRIFTCWVLYRVIQNFCALCTEISNQSTTKTMIFSSSVSKTKKLWKVWKLQSENLDFYGYFRNMLILPYLPFSFYKINGF